jgi:hypothetical protein
MNEGGVTRTRTLRKGLDLRYNRRLKSESRKCTLDHARWHRDVLTIPRQAWLYVTWDEKWTHQFRPLGRVRTTLPRGETSDGLEKIVLEHVYSSVVRTQVINLLVPAYGPEILAYELDRV